MIKTHIKPLLNQMRDAIRHGLLHIMTGNLLVKGISFISSIVIVRIISKEEYAYLSYANTLFNYVTLISGFGLATALLKFCSAEEDPQLDRAYFKFALSRGLFIDGCLSLLILIGALTLSIPFPEARGYITAMALLPCISYIVIVLQSYNRAHLRNKRYAAMGITQAVIVCSLGIGLALLFGAYGNIAARYIGSIAAVTIGIAVLARKNQRRDGKYSLSRPQKKALWSMGISLMIANFFSASMSSNEVMLISHIVLDEIQVANYRVANLIPEQLILVSGSIMIYFFPIFARIENKQRIWKMSLRVGVLNAVLMLFIAVIGVILSPLIIRLAYGEAYRDTTYMSRILWAIRSMNVIFRTVPLNILPAIGKHVFCSALAVISAVAQVIIDYFLISRYGVLGAAYGGIIVYISTALILWIFLWAYCCNGRSDLNEHQN